MQEVYDNPLAAHCLDAYCSRDPDLAAEVDFAIVTFGSHEPAHEVAAKILDLRPWVLGVSCYVWNTDKTLTICDLVRAADPSVLIVAGGPEAGHVPGEICRECPAIDVVVTGEGEETFRHLLLAHLFRQPFDRIPGITFRLNAGKVVSNARRPTIDLASFPPLFGSGQDKYLSLLKQKVMYETIRGCPHVCFFCDWGVLTPGRIRTFPIARVERELSYILRNHPTTHLYLADSEINADDRHGKDLLRAVVRLKRELGWNGDVTFHLEISKDIDSEMADLLCEATNGIGIGVQSLNKSALYQMGRKWFDLERFDHNVRLLERDIHFVFQFIYGCPGDTYRTFFDSLRWAVDGDRDVWFDRLQVLPGTIYRHKRERFAIEFERQRPFFATSSNTFSASDMRRAESLKRGFHLYNFRNYIEFDALRDFLGLDSMELLEAFGEWCTAYQPNRSLTLSRTDPRTLPDGFLSELTGWIGAFVRSRRPITWADYSRLSEHLAGSRSAPAIPASSMAGLRTPRGN